MAVSKVSSIASNLLPRIAEDTLFVARDTSLMPGLVYNYTGTGMATRYIGIYPEVTAQEVSEGVDYSNATEMTKTQQAALVPKTAIAQAILTDERLATDPEGAANDGAMEMGMALAKKIDTDLCALFSGFSTDKGTAGSALTIKRCAAAVSVLRNSSAPNPLSFVLHPYGWQDVWNELGQPTANQAFLGDVANEAMRDYFVGDFLGAAWFTDANIAVDGSDDAVSAVFHRDALALDTRRGINIEPERDASLRATELNATVWYAVGERRDSFGVALTHDATEPTGV